MIFPMRGRPRQGKRKPGVLVRGRTRPFVETPRARLLRRRRPKCHAAAIKRHGKVDGGRKEGGCAKVVIPTVPPKGSNPCGLCACFTIHPHLPGGKGI